MPEYTPAELLRGRFLRHFMGLDQRHDDRTEETEALPADEPPKTRETARPTLYCAAASDLSH